MDFKEINERLLSRAEGVLSEWLPSGRLRGHEWVVGSIQGEAGESLSININTGMWADFAAGDKGGDLISLYAAMNCISQGEAAKKLSPDWKPSKRTPAVIKKTPKKNLLPPEGSTVNFSGNPVESYTYKTRDGKPAFYITKYITKEPNKKTKVIEDKKIFVTYSWDGSKFVKKAWPENRLLYGLEFLNSKPILIVEGEKCVNALRRISKHYTVVSWPGGSNALEKTDWTPIHGYDVLIWPDADDVGMMAAEKIAFKLYGKTKTLKILHVTNRPDGWDAADAVTSGWDWERILDWAKPLARPYLPPQEQVQPLSNDDDAESTASLLDGHSCETMWEYLGLARMKNGAVHCNTDNVVRILDGIKEFKNFVWFDEFHNKLFTKLDGPTREWTDDDDLTMMILIQNKLGLTKINERNITQAVRYLAKRDTRNEPKEWMESLVWDKVNRLDVFFNKCFGSEDTDYSRAASKNWFIGMVARVFNPGCKVDNMVILEASQGKQKSTALDVIGSPWYTEVNEPVTSKDFYLSIQGRLLIEISELDAFSRAESNTIKKVITCREDRFRPPYGRSTESFPRKCVFVGSTNEKHYMRDDTGGRRFWPIKTGDIDIDLIRAQKDQLFAEAVFRYKLGDPWWIMPDSAKDEQEQRRQQDPWEDIINDWLVQNQKTQVRSDEIATGCLKITLDKIDRRVQGRICSVLRILRWETKTLRSDGAKPSRIWIKELTFNVDQPIPRPQPR